MDQVYLSSIRHGTIFYFVSSQKQQLQAREKQRRKISSENNKKKIGVKDQSEKIVGGQV
jgi:hypothetical protein